MLRYFSALDIERFINLLIYNDREIASVYSSWELEKEDICLILQNHFQQLGIFMVSSFGYAELIRKEIIYQLNNSPDIKTKREAVQRVIARARERSRSRGSV